MRRARRWFREPGRVSLRTEEGGGPPAHTHVATFNGDGNGYTSEDAGHWHQVRGLEVLPATPDRHTHQLSTRREQIEDEELRWATR